MSKDTVERIEEMEECLVKYMEGQLAEGASCLAENNNFVIAGEIIDMIKDLADAKKNCYKAEYYKSVTEAMEEYSEEDEKFGYNGRRMANGRYAPAGQGRPGYDAIRLPYPMMMDDPDEWEHHMGYTPSGAGNRSQSGNNPRGGYRDGRNGENSYGRSFEDYRDAKRNYTETRSQTDKQIMDDRAKEHLTHAMGTLKEINETADEQLRIRMRTDLTNLLNQLN